MEKSFGELLTDSFTVFHKSLFGWSKWYFLIWVVLLIAINYSIVQYNIDLPKIMKGLAPSLVMIFGMGLLAIPISLLLWVFGILILELIIFFIEFFIYGIEIFKNNMLNIKTSLKEIFRGNILISFWKLFVLFCFIEGLYFCFATMTKTSIQYVILIIAVLSPILFTTFLGFTFLSGKRAT